MRYQTDRSRQLFERSRGSLIEGGSSASRGPATFGSYPIFMTRGQDAYLYDVDGNRYIDWMMAYGALPLGHAHPAVIEACREGAATGMHFAAATEIEIEVAELIQKMVPYAERVRFANTGTEAVMAAVRLARGYTGRPKILKFEGHYHGWYDDVLVSSNPQYPSSLGHRNDPVKIPDSSGLNRWALQDTIVIPWNDLTALERAVSSSGGQIAAFVTEGIMANMGVVPPADGYLEQMRKIADEYGILLILDETVTGFRVAQGGCQELYGIEADIATFGKALGSGLPVAAITGKATIMEALSWGGVLHFGTQNASRLGLHVARASLSELCRNKGKALHRVWELGEGLCSKLRDLFEEEGARAIVQNVGPMFQIMFTGAEQIRDYRDFCRCIDREKYQRFVLALFEKGIYMTPAATLHSVVTVAHSEEHVDYTLGAVREALRDVQ